MLSSGRIMRTMKFDEGTVRPATSLGSQAGKADPRARAHTIRATEPVLGYHFFIMSECVRCGHAEKTLLEAFNSAEEQCPTDTFNGRHSYIEMIGHRSFSLTW